MSKWNKDISTDEALAALLKAHKTPDINDELRQKHLAESIQVFENKSEKKLSKNTQGNADGGRLISITKLIGDFTMKKFYVAGGAVAMSVLAVSLMNSTMLSSFDEVLVTPPPSKIVTQEVDVQAPAKEDISEQAGQRRDREAESKNMQTAEIVASPPALTAPVSKAKKESVARQHMVKPLASHDASSFMAQGNIASQSLGRSMVMPSPDMVAPPRVEPGRDKFESIDDNPVKLTNEEPVSTFSVDVDTASYSFVRRQLNAGVLPQKNAVRVEEMINYFDYNYPQKANADAPFSTQVKVIDSPWNADKKLMHIGIKGYDIEKATKPRSNLVFLIDTSGSMSSTDKLPLLRNAFKMMVNKLDENDTVSIATYAGSTRIALEPTKVKDSHKIIAALENLNAGGSTAGAAGIKLAYQLAEQQFDEDAVNRVFIATDGDFNVGISNQEELKSYIERKRESGVFLSVLGFGQGNYNDALMQTLAQNGNGTAAYIDTLSESRKVFVEEASSSLFTIAKDVKIQVEFNPEKVAEYRLIGYQTRALNREDFNNDKVDAGEIGSGHTVTAIYEVTSTGSDATQIDPLRYGKKDKAVVTDATSDEWGFVKLRYKLPTQDTSKLLSYSIGKANEVSLGEASDDVRFSTAVAAFGQKLRGGRYLGAFGYDDVISLANGAKGEDSFGYRAEFVNLVRLAQSADKM